MSRSYQLFAGVVSALLSLTAMVLGIMLTNSVTMSFGRMIFYDLIFVFQFLGILWCALVFYRKD